MPIYTYVAILKNGREGKPFEIRQKISDPPLSRHPKTGKPVRRVLLPFNSPKGRYDKAVKQLAAEDSKSMKTIKAKSAGRRR